MQKEVDEFKAATLDRLCIIAASDVGQTAKLIAVCEALGASPEQMATIVGRATRAMQMARKELRAENCADAQKTAPRAQEIAPSAENCAQKIAHGAKSCASSAENCASPARGVVPNPTTVEVVDTNTPTTHTPSPSFKVSPSPLPPSPVAKVCKRGARLPDDWKLPVDWQQWARVNFPATSAEAVTLEADKFRDFWCSKAGQGATKLDWQATWRNWCRTAFAAKPGRQPVNNGRSAYDERMARQRAQIAEARALIAARGARDAAHH